MRTNAWLIATTLVTTLVTTLSAPAMAQGDGVGWPQYRGNTSRSGYRVWLTPAPTGDVVWQTPVGRMHDSSPVVDPVSGTIVVGTEETAAGRSLVALTPGGAEKWAARLPAPFSQRFGYRVRSTPAFLADGGLIASGYLYIPNRDGAGRITGYTTANQLFVVDRTGVVTRSEPADPLLALGSPLYLSDSEIYVWKPSTSGAGLYRYDRQLRKTNVAGYAQTVTGGFDWPSWCDIFVCYDPSGVANPAIEPRQALLPSPALDHIRLHAVAVQGATVRARTTGSTNTDTDKRNVYGLTTPIVANGIMYLAAKDGTVSAYNGKGERQWKYKMAATPVAQPALVTSGSDVTIYAPAADGWLYAIGNGGVLRWKKQVGLSCRPDDRDGECLGAPIVLGINGSIRTVVVVPTNRPDLRALDRNGELLWRVPLDGPSRGSPAAVKERIYVATDKSVYAIR